MTQYERMISELPYRGDAETRAMMRENKRRLYEYNHLPPERWHEEEALLRCILGKVGSEIHIEQPFHCDYGRHIEVGDNFYANYNLVVLDVAKVKIGSNVFCAPNVGIYTAGHPVHSELRNAGWEYGIGIEIGDSVWIGGNAVILPGVKIGSNVVIGAGSVVCKDIPSNVVAAGNPCRPLRGITKDDRTYYFKRRAFDVSPEDF
ncbi:MAG: sugar O-acetyltransferase [Treponemataceae bacterium]|nr:sugar O-acetyltransferase [Treponemataceae bacterium]